MRTLTRTVALTFLILQLAGGAMAFACDEICHDNEVYSDSAEMCVPQAQPST